MKNLAYINLFVLLVISLFNFQEVKAQKQEHAQEQEIALQVSTFARQVKFIYESKELDLTVREGEQEITPENINVKQIKQTIIAIDNSNSMKYILKGLVKHLEKGLPETIVSPTKVVTFNEEIEILSSFTTSKSELIQSLKKVQLTQKRTKLFKVIEQLKQLTANELTHLIVLTDGADTDGQIINIKELLSSPSLTVSYVNWGYADPSLSVDEPGYNPSGKSRIIEVKPNAILSIIAQRSGGDVVNLTNWKDLKLYIDKKLKMGVFLYDMFWHTDNPMKAVYFQKTRKNSNFTKLPEINSYIGSFR